MADEVRTNGLDDPANGAFFVAGWQDHTRRGRSLGRQHRFRGEVLGSEGPNR